VNVATQRVQDAEDSLNAALDTGDENAISVAEQDFGVATANARGGEPGSWRASPDARPRPQPAADGWCCRCGCRAPPDTAPADLTGSAPMTANEYVPPLASMGATLAVNLNPHTCSGRRTVISGHFATAPWLDTLDTRKPGSCAL